MEVVHIFGDHEDFESAQVTFRLCSTGEHIVISLFKSEQVDSEAPEAVPEVDRLIRLLGQYLAADDYEEQQALEDEALDPIYDAAETIISSAETAAQDTSSHQHTSLHSVLYPKSSHFRLESKPPHGTLSLVPIPAQEACAISFEDGQALLEHQSDLKPIDSLPRYSTSRIQVVEQYARGGGTVCLVKIDGHDEEKFLCKARPDGLRNSSLEREIDCLQRILSSKSSATYRIPTLQGYITHPATGAIVGFVRQWIPGGLSIRHLQDRTEEKSGLVQNPPRDLRKKWAGQITETIRFLHSIGVVWGDAKPSNVIVSLQNDAYLVDFGGGWSDGWVDENLHETVQGDEQGVGRILTLLDGGE